MLGHLLRAGRAVEAEQRHDQGASITVIAAATSAPTSSVPVVSTVICTKIGCSPCAALRAALAALTPALICSVSWQVSISIASTPALDQPAALHGQRGFERVVMNMAERGQPRSRTDHTDDETRLTVGGESADLPSPRQRGGAVVERMGFIRNAELAEGVSGETPKLLVWIASAPASR